MSLCKVAEFDVRDSILLEERIQEFEYPFQISPDPSLSAIQTKRTEYKKNCITKRKIIDYTRYWKRENVRKKSISKKLGMDATHEKEVNDKIMFSRRLHSAKNCSKNIIIRKMVVINKTKRKYCISGSGSSRSIHEVIKANTPTFSCADIVQEFYANIFMFSKIRYRIFNSR